VRLISLVPNKEITPIYLKNYIDIKMNIEGNGAAQPQLTIPMIKSMEIMVPPIELQNRFATFVEQTDKSKLAIQKSLDELETLKKALMQEYFG
jgi:type I restriction enzyme S subunit